MIKFWIEDGTGRHPVEVPEENGFSLMEILRASGYPIAATCGGMALCATCLVQVATDAEKLDRPGDAEVDMLDALPLGEGHFRLSCQIRVNEQVEGRVFKLDRLR